MKNTAACISFIGLSRSNHEDNFLLHGKYITPTKQKKMSLQKKQHISLVATPKKTVQLYAVSDGMGGHNSGEVASYITVQMLSELELSLQGISSINEIHMHCQTMLNKINDRIYSLGLENIENKGMGATVVLLIIYKNHNIVMNIGDSRAYFYDGSQLTQITRDNTEGQRLLDYNLMTVKDLDNFPERKHLSKYIGMPINGGILKADEFIDHALCPGWFMLCSDGISDILTDLEFTETLNMYFKKGNVKIAAKKVIKKALYKAIKINTITDNMTLMLIKCC